MKRWVKLSSMILAVLMLVLTLPASAASAESYEDPPCDFVILLDCSMSLGTNDPQNLCLEACKNFIDTLPAENARVSVIALGYQGGETYAYSSKFEITDNLDANLIHLIVPLSNANSTKDKDQFKAVVEDALVSNRNNRETWTPIGHGLAAAVDMLEQNGASDGKACIICVSDGVLEPRDPQADKKLVEPASTLAGEHQWPVYCIELNYNNSDKFEVAAAQQFLDQISANSGCQEVGRISCDTPREVHAAFQQIFFDFYNTNGNTEEITLPGEYVFDVPDLTSEANVNIFGASIEYVELINVAEGTSKKISKDTETESLIATVEEGSYYSIKLLCPTAGQWKVQLYGEEKATVLVSNITLQEMGLSMQAKASSSDLTKNDSISVDACFAYRGTETHNNSFYEKNPASLVVYCADGTTKEFTMEASKDGYHYDLPLSGLPSGSFQLQVVLRHSMFRDGKKSSNVQSFKMENLPLQLAGAGAETYYANVNGNFSPIDLTKIFINPDNDPIQYTVSCVSDRSAVFEQKVDSDYMTIEAGYVPGTFDVEISAADYDMAEPVVYNMTLVVTNTPPTAEKLPKQELWVDKYLFQKADKRTLELDLDKYFSDPDGMELSYTVSGANGIVEINQEGSALTFVPQKKGETTISITASDGIEEVSGEFKLNVVSGKAAYWRQYWIFYVIALAVLLFVVISVVIILKNKRVKGTWQITFNENGLIYEMPDMDIGAFTRCGRKSSFLFKDLVLELVPFLGDNAGISLSVNNYFLGTGAEKIKIKGVYGKKGLIISNVPKDGAVKAICNGIPVAKQAKLNGGKLVVEIVLPDSGDTLKIDMLLR